MIKKIIKRLGKKIKDISGISRKKQPHIQETPLPAGSVSAGPAKTIADHARQRRSPEPSRKPASPEKAGSASRPRPESKRNKPWDLTQFQVPPAPGKSRFHDFDLSVEIMHAIADLGFDYCTPIQATTLPETLQGHDLIGRAQTGTGKTAAFLINICTTLLNERDDGKRATGTPRALIIAPTRELVMQIAKDAKDLTKYTPLTTVAVFGGVDYQKQMSRLENETIDLMAATPGRLLDYLNKRVVRLDKVRILVLDEADRMLDMGFIPDVRRIVSSTPPKETRQTLFFSATITDEVRRLASQWTRKAATVDIEPDQVAVDTIDQIVYLTSSKEKYTVLYNLVTKQNLDRVLVFTNRRDEARKLTDRLKRNGINCDMLSGEVEQKKRMSRLEDFRNGKIKVLVATDVAGRGIHIEGISHVINYTLPYEPEDYVHRIGRTGRAGVAGISISFACEEGGFYLPDIEKFIGRKLECVRPEEALLTPPPRGSSPLASEAPPAKRRGSSRPPAGRRPRSRTSFSAR
ncbi:MAG: ATP-dependent RNA helicase RhlB [Deltaproteobacteria bacterium CG23_combo_of_CG06-09_8_20_14_all_60_8]|nr:MAG: ATP-dependent RNA helicase RhlB [Desulfobacterales bacterium CG2_30_60_27]PIP43239.1 MAG: ATP-dependent RNA helicase RhlB [Deltaproteobacteria bacterium CG23_combo_of_CG06-09_8_20_14_all_60_8]